MSATLAMQRAIRARLVADFQLGNLVPASNILDRNALPAPDPSIVLGEGQAIDEGDVARKVQRVFSTLHIWKKEPSLAGVQAIAGAIRTAIHSGRPNVPDWNVGDWRVSDMRFLRDPDGETSHGVVTVESLVSEA